MGAKLCSPADDQAPQGRLLFHADAKGTQVCLEKGQSTARRKATFHDGIVFSSRPVQPCERVVLRILCHESHWHGGLRVGFTRLDPTRVWGPCLPPFLCPDLEQQSPTWAAVLPNHCVLPGNVVCFWVNSRGRLFLQVNSNCPIRLRKNVPLGHPLWAVMDVYGTTKAIELLDPTASARPTAVPKVVRHDFQLTAEEECVICYHHAANTCLVPCGHSLFCHHCAWQVLRDTAMCPLCRCEIKAMAQCRALLLQGQERALQPDWCMGPDWT